MYQPGEPYTRPAGSVTSIIGAEKRLLTAPEFNYYYNLLLDESIPAVYRAGMAVVLKADTVRVYQQYHKEFTDELLDKWVETFNNYTGGLKATAREEVRKFDEFLTYTRPPSSAQGDALKANRLAYAMVLGGQIRKEQLAEKAQELLALETESHFDKRRKEEEERQAKVALEAVERHMRNNIRQYLSGIYNDHMARYFMDLELSEKEYEARMRIIRAVENREILPMVGFNAYYKVLDKLPDNPTPMTLKLLLDKEFGLMSHPMQKGVLQ